MTFNPTTNIKVSLPFVHLKELLVTILQERLASLQNFEYKESDVEDLAPQDNTKLIQDVKDALWYATEWPGPCETQVGHTVFGHSFPKHVSHTMKSSVNEFMSSSSMTGKEAGLVHLLDILLDREASKLLPIV